MPYQTPSNLPSVTVCRRLVIPADPFFVAAVSGALYELCKPENWQQSGAVTPDEAARASLEMFTTWLESDCT